jgi:hypothetical protein
MMISPRHCLPLLVACAVPFHAFGETALNALKALPRGEARKVTSIQATEGAPAPQAWTLQVPDAKLGSREYVVVKGEIVSSQAAAKAADARGGKPQSLLGDGTIKIDSDRAAQIALQQAQAEGIDVVSLNYRLQKSGPKAAPVWVITCLDAKGAELGSVAISAITGNPLAQDGFAFGGHPAPQTNPPEDAGAPTTTKPVDPQIANEDRKFLAEQAAEFSTDEPPAASAATPPPAAENRIATESQPPAPEGIASKESEDGSNPAHAAREEIAETREGSARGRHGSEAERDHRGSARSISPVGEVRRATAPVRHIVHRILPF